MPCALATSEWTKHSGATTERLRFVTVFSCVCVCVCVCVSNTLSASLTHDQTRRIMQTEVLRSISQLRSPLGQHDLKTKALWSFKMSATKGAFTRVPQVDQHGWINEIEFNGWTILLTRFHKSERGSRFQNGGKWTCAGRCCCNMRLFNKRMSTHFRKNK